MNNWTEGYVTDIDYTHGYYSILSPTRMNFAALLANQRPVPMAAGTTYLELGFGQGLSLNIHAAVHEGEFWGSDFNPAQAANAQSLAATSGANLRVLEDSFEELAARDGVPDFDFIALHGIWSWVSAANRDTIVEIIRKKLKPGGLVYVSYNALPGWAASLPLRNLMKEISDREPALSVAERVKQVFAFTKQLIDAEAGYFTSNQSALKKLESFQDKPVNYIAHEYLNADWEPMAFGDTARMLRQAKLNYVGSSFVLDYIPALNLSKPAQEMLAGIEDKLFKETIKDYFINQSFRRDIFAKGSRPMSAAERSNRLQQQKFVLIVHPEDRPEHASGSLLKADLQAEVYGPLCEALADDDFKPMSIVDLAADPRVSKKLNINQVLEAMTILCGTEACAPIADNPLAKTVLRNARALNTEIIRRAEASPDISFLAAPLLGTGIGVNRIDQLLIRAATAKEKDPPGWIWQLLESQGQKIVKDGKKLETAEENLQEINTRYEDFNRKRIPVLKRLGIL